MHPPRVCRGSAPEGVSPRFARTGGTRGRTPDQTCSHADSLFHTCVCFFGAVSNDCSTQYILQTLSAASAATLLLLPMPLLPQWWLSTSQTGLVGFTCESITPFFKGFCY